MRRSKGAGKRSVCAAVLLAALAVPILTASTAAASDFGVTIYYRSAATCAISARTGTLTLDGRCYVVGEYCDAQRDLAQIFCDMGYRARYDGSRIIIDTYGCRIPQFCWESCDYDLETTWRGDYLIIGLRRICHEPATIYYTPAPRFVYFNWYGDYCDTGFHISIGSRHDRGWDHHRDDRRGWDRDRNDHDRDWNRGRDDNNRGNDRNNQGPGQNDQGRTGPDRSNERLAVPGADNGLLHLSGGSSGGGRSSGGSSPIAERSSPMQRSNVSPSSSVPQRPAVAPQQRPTAAPARPTQTQRPTAAPARPTQTQRPTAAPARPTQTQRPTAAPARPTQTQRPTGPDRTREQRAAPGAADGRLHLPPNRGSSNNNKSGHN